MNYMDYVDDDSMFMFAEDQANAHERSALDLEARDPSFGWACSGRRRSPGTGLVDARQRRRYGRGAGSKRKPDVDQR